MLALPQVLAIEEMKPDIPYSDPLAQYTKVVNLTVVYRHHLSTCTVLIFAIISIICSTAKDHFILFQRKLQKPLEICLYIIDFIRRNIFLQNTVLINL